MTSTTNPSTDEHGTVSTPSRSRRTRPHPPWPVSPVTPHSPTRTNYSPVCPGAPVKKRPLGGSRLFQEDSSNHTEVESEDDLTERMREGGLVPRRLDFGEDYDLQHDSRGASANTIRRHDDYPIVHIGISSPSSEAAPPRCPTSSQMDNDSHDCTRNTTRAPALEMRPRRQGKPSTRPL